MHKYIIFIIFIALLHGCDGIAVRTGPKMAPTMVENIDIFFDPPSGYIELGKVETEVSADAYESECYVWAVDKLKILASNLGANGLIIYPHERKFIKWNRNDALINPDSGEPLKPDYSVAVHYLVKGLAIRMNEKKDK